jgi:hypothetical protein
MADRSNTLEDYGSRRDMRERFRNQHKWLRQTRPPLPQHVFAKVLELTVRQRVARTVAYQRASEPGCSPRA